MPEKRKATRIKYRCGVTLSLENGISTDGQIRDLSLRGAHVTVSDLSLFQAGDKCGFQIRLSGVDDKITVSGAARIVRKDTNQSLGICFLGVNTDDLGQLHRIIVLNFGDSGKIDKELQALMGETAPKEQR